MLAMALALATTGGGYLLVLAIIVPVIGMLLSLVVGGRHAERIALALVPAGLGLALAIAIAVWVTDQPLVYIVGGWAPPLGIALRADGFSAVMLVTAALVIAALGVGALALATANRADVRSRAPVSARRRNSRKSARRSPSGRCCRRCGRRWSSSSWAAICSISMSRWNC